MRPNSLPLATKPPALALLWAIMLGVNLLMALGLTRVSFDDGLAEVFESTDPIYADYQAYLSDFSVSEGDLLVVFTGADFTTPEAYARLRDFVFEVQFEPEVAGLLSPFSFDLPPPGEGDLAARVKDLRQENPAFRRFLSEDNTLALVAVIAARHGPEEDAQETGPPLHERVLTLARRITEGSGVTVRLTGYPALRDIVVAAVFGDFWRNSAIGITIGTIVSVIALRSVALALLATVTSATALLWMLGLFGFLGLTINVVTISLPVLILVLSFAAAIHLTLEVRRRTRAGDTMPVRLGVWRIGPACILTTLTTAAAFGSLMTSPSTLIINMGLAGVVATLASLVAVFAMHPLLLASIGRRPGFGWLFRGNRGRAPKVLHLAFLPAIAARRPGLVALVSLGLLAAAVVTYMRVVPVYSLYDHVATDSDAYQALAEVERSLAPIGSVAFPTRFSLDQPGAIERLRQAGQVLARHAGGLEVLSLADFIGAGEDLQSELAALPEILRGRLLSRDGTTPLLMVLVPNEGAVAVRALIDDLTGALAADPDWPAAEIGAPTGLLAASSFLSRDMLLDLNRCFLVAVIVSGLVVALWLRNPVLGLVALIPNVLPVALVGAWLTLSGAGLEFSSGIALTIAFGLAIDDTIHVLNRMRLDAGPGQAVDRELIMGSLRRVSPALVITSAVLSFGLLGTQFGQLPMIAYFGRLSIAAFVLALIADLLVLPAVLIVMQRLLPARFLRIGS